MALISKAELTAAVNKARSTMIQTWSKPVLEHQRITASDSEAKGRCWVSRVTLSAPPEGDLLHVICDAVTALGDGDGNYTFPSTGNVSAQWTAFRAGVTRKAPEPRYSEAEKYSCLMDEVSCPLTILYACGGAHYINGPSTHRATAATLAELTQGRCLLVQHRLAPQNTFPAQILDLFIAYLSLLYPQPDSYHNPVAASDIVFASDSSGAALGFALIQIILFMRRRQSSNKPTLLYHGREVEVPMPAGVAALSPGLDHVATLPSWNANRNFDIFGDVMPGYMPGFPTDAAWPSDPPRGSFYCETSMLTHPLVSPLMARDWAGAPPIYIAVGSKERLSDSTKYVAQTLARQGVAVLWDEYELMPHNWPMVFPRFAHSRKCYESWAAACLKFWRAGQVEGHGTFTSFADLSTKDVDVRNLTPLTFHEIKGMMQAGQRDIRPFTGERSIKSVL